MRLPSGGMPSGRALCVVLAILSFLCASPVFSASTGLPVTEVPPLQSAAAVDLPPEDIPTDSYMPADEAPDALPADEIKAQPRDETILIQSTGKKNEPIDRMRSYFIQTGASLPIYDEDFREFVDYGGSITLGVKKKVMDHLYFLPTLGLTLLNGDWNLDEHRQSLRIEDQYYNTTYGDYTGGLTPGNINPTNTGDGYMSGVTAVIDGEALRSIDLQTSMYLIPLTLNIMYQLHDDEQGKIKPYIGGGIGFCVAKRDVESRTLKEKRYEGPTYFLDFYDNQTVTGQVFQLFAGIEIPFSKNIKFVADSTTTLYDLRSFDPILTVSYKLPNPDYYPGSDLTSFSLEDDKDDIGLFKEEFVTSLSIGLVIPF